METATPSAAYQTPSWELSGVRIGDGLGLALIVGLVPASDHVILGHGLGHDLSSADLACNLCGDLVGGLGQSQSELLHDVQEEGHGEEPANPARSEVTCDNQFAVLKIGHRVHHHGCETVK